MEIPPTKNIDLEAFARDYEANMSSADLVRKYGIGRTCVAYFANKAGARIRHTRVAPGGNRPRPAAEKQRGEETNMPWKAGRAPRAHVDLVKFKHDYEAGMSGRDLEEKYHIGIASSSKWARKAGARICTPGGRGAASGNGSKPRKHAARSAPAQERLGKVVEAGLESHDERVFLCLSRSALDAIWASLPIERKARLIEALAA
jgi:hypothetical protein